MGAFGRFLGPAPGRFLCGGTGGPPVSKRVTRRVGPVDDDAYDTHGDERRTDPVCGTSSPETTAVVANPATDARAMAMSG